MHPTFPPSTIPLHIFAFCPNAKQGFSCLGRTIGSHPLISLAVSTVVAVILCAGLTLFSVTTNPVELWSGPMSRSRLEKNFFDKNFAYVFSLTLMSDIGYRIYSFNQSRLVIWKMWTTPVLVISNYITGLPTQKGSVLSQHVSVDITSLWSCKFMHSLCPTSEERKI